jgi:hypothetical protein
MFIAQAAPVPVEVQQNVWIVAIQASYPLIALFSLWVQKKWADSAARHAKDVKVALVESTSKTEQQLTHIDNTTIQTHTLVNSRLGIVLQNMAILTREKAITLKEKAESSGSPEDWKLSQSAETAADAAEKDLQQHQTQQAIVDAGKST